MDVKTQAARTPYVHKHHYITSTCGCWTPEEKGEYIICDHCGATYMRVDVMSFNLFRCYDCGCGWSLKYGR